MKNTNTGDRALTHVIATYRVRDKQENLSKRAEGIAVGLTVGSWTDLPAMKQSAVLRHCGTVEDIRVLDTSEAPSSDASVGDPVDRGHAALDTVIADISIGYPIDNFNNTITSILTTVFGKLSMDGEIRLIALQIPDALAERFSGPKFGVSGIRDRLKIYDRPLLMSIFKACVGRDVSDLTKAFLEQARGGADLIKDDEIFFSEQYATPEARVAAFTEAARQLQAETGQRVSYAVNLTGPVRQLFDRARRLAELGAGALLVNAVAYGYDVLAELAADPDVTVPLMVHPAVSGALYGSDTHGIAADIVLGSLMRLAGADIVIYPSPYGTVTLSRAEGLRLVDALRTPSVHKEVLPAPSAGIFPGLVPKLVSDLGVDCIVNAGGAIHGHPGGATDGAAAFMASIEATVAGVSLEQAANGNAALKAALKKWGQPS
ncbi:2,3-diketo-5-methylthiopentyl-1-phosphate enolase [Alicyclobacillus ferrooxydans]|uniref:2,3-diketo-5-methylthiopentyl-1-phosphate enolase n=1 Tax=Alicyclobacillus ferrooxydans TaxID=471514 RepID=A0A0P9EPY9_9BACL|nr:2,3-diketo-5-methylthiopentyl-1-phosphate enolase [Alicyclobacillus ferrooxydans]KPV45554.1 2,3-diketo-5-methylthiopentyl-1-phosphate enolase [Alicyclobacillus ferrooxydans]